MKKTKIAFYILTPIVVGIIIGIITMPFNNYDELVNPPLSPPAIVFPIVWTILYTLMGISAYLVAKNGGNLLIYYVQLAFNASWSIVYFVFKLRLLAFIIILILLGLIIAMIIKFYEVNKLSAYLQIPYLLWVAFASYLNLGVYLLN